MERLADFVGSRLEWIQPKTFGRYYELRCGEALLATLSFRSALGTQAVAQTAEGQWIFRRTGFFKARVTVRAAGEEDSLAVYHPSFWGKGVLTFVDGASYTWTPTNFWRTRWTFTDSAGELHLRFVLGREKKRLSDVFKTQATVEVRAEGAAQKLLPVLLPLGMYLLRLHQEDATVVVAASSAVLP